MAQRATPLDPGWGAALLVTTGEVDDVHGIVGDSGEQEVSPRGAE